ncbi:MAG: hypothetical protein JNJ61_26355, partial [Anaerolineae bacterium]|nr:hypothetical protein [Anaerolineae bacterium]
ARYRLRHTPPRYSVPLTLEIGEGAAAQRRRFDEFAALGRIAFNFDFSSTLGDYLRESAPLVTCDVDDLVVNGDFSQPPIAFDLEIESAISGVPDAWTLARGMVARGRRVADGPVVLALWATSANGVLRPARLLQEVPVGAGCAYQLRFYYAAPFNAASRWMLRWLDADGAELGEDGAALPARTRGLRDVPMRDLLPYEARLAAPAGATLAEIAFEIDAPDEDDDDDDDGGIAFAVGLVPQLLLAGASFTPTSEALTNTHFWVGTTIARPEQQPLFVPDGWTLEGGIAFREDSGGILVIEADAQTATLTQVAPITAGARYHLRLEGQAGTADAALELYWLDADLAPIGQPERVSIGVYAFGAHLWSGSAPASAASAAVQVVIPAGAALLLNSIHLLREQEQVATLRFLAESPGHLKVSDLRVSFDQPAPPPALLPLDLLTPQPRTDDAGVQGLTPGALRGQGLTPGALRGQGLTPGALRGQALTPGALQGAVFASTLTANLPRASAFADRPVDIVSGIGARFAEALRDLPQPVTTIRELAALHDDMPLPRANRERLLELRAAAEMIIDINVDVAAFSPLAGESLETLLARNTAEIARQSGQSAASAEHLLRKLRALRFLLQNDVFRALNLSDLA